MNSVDTFHKRLRDEIAAVEEEIQSHNQQVQRYAGEFFWRKPELKGKDKPKATTVNA
jgi:hypothetical protein